LGSRRGRFETCPYTNREEASGLPGKAHRLGALHERRPNRTNTALLVALMLLAAAGLTTAATADAYGRLPHGLGFRNVRDYGAKGDGVTDDTAAFMRALDEGRGSVREKAPANVYIPPGTYLISDTLIIWRATLLAGDADHPPTLVLKDHAPGFDDPANPKPLLVTALGYNIDAKSRDWHTRTNEIGGSTNNTFFITVRHLNIRLGQGNPGAWGLFWLVAQQTALRNVTIDAGEAQGCLKSMWWGGGGVISHVRLVGGDFGWHVQETSQWVARSLELRGQRKASLWLDHVWSFALLDLKVERTAPVRLLGGAVSLIDSTFADIVGDTAIQSDGAALILQNVATRGVREVVKGTLPARPQGETIIARWAAGVAMVDGQTLPGETHDLSAALPRPERLSSPAYPVPTAATRSVTDFGAKGDGKADDTAAVQRALDQCREVFFPDGTYLISDTLRLRPASKLFGEMWSVIELKADAPGFQDPASDKPMLDIPDDPKATVTVCHLQCHMATPGGIHCDWRAGERSMLVDTTFYDYRKTSRLNWRLSGRGGGFFENSWNPGVAGDGLDITSTGRKWFYSVQQEHYQGTALSLRGARRLVGLVFQFETSPRYVRIEDCKDIALFGTLAGNWSEPVPSLVHMAHGRNLALFNSACTNCGGVITEEPHAWNAGPASPDRGFARQPVWVRR